MCPCFLLLVNVGTFWNFRFIVCPCFLVLGIVGTFGNFTLYHTDIRKLLYMRPNSAVGEGDNLEILLLRIDNDLNGMSKSDFIWFPLYVHIFTLVF